MSNISLLDCTLRDGGYVNDWKFGNGIMACIVDRLVCANIDIIEVGFLDDRVPFDINKSIQPSTECYKKIFGNTDKKNSKLLAMIDYGTCSLDNIEERTETIFDGIRLIFKISKIEGALNYAQELIAKGYEVYLQMVSITSYSDRDILNFVEKVNRIKPYAVSIVDTYGLMHKEEVLHYFDLLDHNLTDGIHIGYHSHNNFQLGYANAIEFILKKSKHDKIIDGTLYGMGKSAGNAPLELIAMYLNESTGAPYDMNQILEAIDNNILNIYKQKYWGYAFNFYISALNDCHPNYVTHYLNKNTLSVKSVNELLLKIPSEKKLTYDEKFAEELYLRYQSKAINDEPALSELSTIFKEKDVMILGPGRSTLIFEEKITSAVRKNDLITIAVNHIPPTLKCDYIFISNSKRYNLIHKELLEYREPVIITSNISPFEEKHSEIIINYNRLIADGDGKLQDSSLILLLELLIHIHAKKAILAGFDGFSSDLEENYSDSRMILSQNFDINEYNNCLKKSIQKYKNRIKLEFLTPSIYYD